MILTAGPVFGIPLNVGLLLMIAGTMAATNAVLAWRSRRDTHLTDSLCGLIFVFDTLELTALLFISGGTSNPFSVFYLVQITVASVTLPPRWTWFLAILGVSSYAALFLLPAGAGDSRAHAAHLFARHLQAMWVALTLSAALTAYFVTRLTRMLAEREREVTTMREIAARHERLAALTTLAAGAAHELGTPLATVAVAAGELERAIAGLPTPEMAALGDDVRLIRAEVRRCRDILDGMAGESGDAAGEMPTSFSAADLVQGVVGSLSREDAERISVTDRASDAVLFLPRRALTRAALSLVRNALDASQAPAPVVIEVDAAAGRFHLRVRDRGLGMTREVLSRAGEPFFTTKPAGRGLGLGLFLVRSLADNLTGRFGIDSSPGYGTTAALDLPMAIEADAARV